MLDTFRESGLVHQESPNTPVAPFDDLDPHPFLSTAGALERTFDQEALTGRESLLECVVEARKLGTGRFAGSADLWVVVGDDPDHVLVGLVGW
jgi:hypothetical protein